MYSLIQNIDIQKIFLFISTKTKTKSITVVNPNYTIAGNITSIVCICNAQIKNLKLLIILAFCYMKVKTKKKNTDKGVQNTDVH